MTSPWWDKYNHVASSPPYPPGRSVLASRCGTCMYSLAASQGSRAPNWRLSCLRETKDRVGFYWRRSLLKLAKQANQTQCCFDNLEQVLTIVHGKDACHLGRAHSVQGRVIRAVKLAQRWFLSPSPHLGSFASGDPIFARMTFFAPTQANCFK